VTTARAEDPILRFGSSWRPPFGASIIAVQRLEPDAGGHDLMIWPEDGPFQQRVDWAESLELQATSLPARPRSAAHARAFGDEGCRPLGSGAGVRRSSTSVPQGP
jgi:hypothetical protein